jgi:peptide/nickel transport system permease protein
MLGEARSALITNPHTSIVPGVMILIIVMAINLLGDGVRDALDPRLKSGALSRPHARDSGRPYAALSPARVRTSWPSRQPQTQFHVKDRVYGRRRRRPEVKPGECLGIIGEAGRANPSPRCRHGPCRLAARRDHRRAVFYKART